MESVIFDTVAHGPACFAWRYDVAFHHAMSHAISQYINNRDIVPPSIRLVCNWY